MKLKELLAHISGIIQIKDSPFNIFVELDHSENVFVGPYAYLLEREVCIIYPNDCPLLLLVVRLKKEDED